jgi:predicted ATPase
MTRKSRRGVVKPAFKSRNFLLRLSLRRDEVPSFDAYPFSIPAVAGLSELRFDHPVTFLIGENGSGKSTLIEALAVAWGLNPEGGSRNFNFATRASHSGLGRYLRLTRSPRRARDAYFLRAESYYNVATQIEALDEEPGGGPKIIGWYGGKSLHEQSHGESFFALFMNRLGAKGFFILDEPEAALSPSRQLAFLSRMHDLVRRGSQFVIATHSPILMAYPDAAIYQLGDGAARLVDYRETEHFTVTRNFLTRTDQMLAVLLKGSEEDE